jgi:predicted regulator of Ras-like GTPase activity (Roadblock/LC7/MglB family)
MDISQAVQEILMKLLKSSRGLLQIMLTDPTGLVISQVSKKQNNYGLEGIGGLASALYFGMREQGESLMNLGTMGFMISEFSTGKLIMQGIGMDYVLIGVTNPRTNIRRLRNAVKRYKKELTYQIDLLKTSYALKERAEAMSQKEYADALSELNI